MCSRFSDWRASSQYLFAQANAESDKISSSSAESQMITSQQHLTLLWCIVFAFQILEYTPSDHGDHEPLAAAQKKAEELCSQVNEGVRMQENSDRLEWFQTHINTTGLPEVRDL